MNMMTSRAAIAARASVVPEFGRKKDENDPSEVKDRGPSFAARSPGDSGAAMASISLARPLRPIRCRPLTSVSA